MDLPPSLIRPLLALAWLVLLGAPVAGVFIARRLRRKPGAVLAVAVFTALIPALLASRISTANQTVNLALCFAAYAGYCALAPFSLRLRRLWLRVPVAVAVFLPVAAGYFMATAGALALLLLLAQSYPLSRQAMRPGLTCETAGWGVPGTADAGYDVILYRSPVSLPWIRLQAYSLRVTVAPGNPGPWPGCTEAVQHYDDKH